MAPQSGAKVPGGVAVVAALAIVIGIVQVVGGVLLLIFSGDADPISTGEAVVWGIIIAVIGAIYLAVGFGLLRLRSWALFVGLVVSGVRSVFDIVWLIAIGLAGIGIGGLISLIINLLVFFALYSGRRAFDRP